MSMIKIAVFFISYFPFELLHQTEIIWCSSMYEIEHRWTHQICTVMRRRANIESDIAMLCRLSTHEDSVVLILYFSSNNKKNRDLNDLYATAYKFMLWQFYSGRDDELPTSLLYSLSISVLSIHANQFWSSSCLWLCHICMREQHFPSRKTYIQLENRKEVLFQFCRCRNYPLLLHLHISY